LMFDLIFLAFFGHREGGFFHWDDSCLMSGL